MTKNEIVALAFKRIGIGVDQMEMTAGQQALGADFFDLALAEINDEALAPYSEADVPNGVALAMADMVAADIAPSFALPAPMLRSRAKLRALGFIRPYGSDDTAVYY